MKQDSTPISSGKLRFSHQIGIIHFVGIGGIGMSGIAEVLHNLNYTVTGSDIAENANVQRLQNLGITITIGHKADNVENVGVVVVSTAIQADNPEYQAARQKHIPIVKRAEMLGELMRLKRSIAVAGTHGKTTTTTLIATLLDTAGWDPTVINGGIINAFGSNTRMGESDWMVVEADESDGSFLHLPADVALITNIDPEHLDHYGTFDAIKQAFHNFIERLPFYGFGVLCLDHPEVQNLITNLEQRQLITYGTNPQADVVLFNIEQSLDATSFDIRFQGRNTEARTLKQLKLPMPGFHNVLNATGALALASQLGMDDDGLRRGLQNFQGVKRRFTHVGEVNSINFYDDYGHHPVEIRAVLDGARAVAKGRIIAVFQPHRFTRLRDLFNDFCASFNKADITMITPVYAAGENPIKNVNSTTLVDGITAAGHRSVRHIENDDDLVSAMVSELQEDDMVICLGAGSISAWANALPERYKKAIDG